MTIDKVIKILIEKDVITKDELKSLGFNFLNIVFLTDDEYIKPIGGGIYNINNLDVLVSFGVEKLEERNFSFANKIFDYVYKVDNKNFSVNFQLFNRCIKQNEYEKSLEYFNVVYTSLIEKERERDANYYLLLLSHLIQLPKEYMDVVKTIELSDISLVEVNSIARLENRVRQSIFYHYFYEANKCFKKRVSMDDRVTVNDTLEKNLINAIITKYNNINLDTSFINDLIKLMNDKKISFEEALKELKLDINEANYAKLLYAKDCFYLKEFKRGDKVVAEVERSKNKSQEIKNMLNEIRQNRKFYFNRLNESEENQLVFRK